MKRKIISITLLVFVLAACAKLVTPGALPTPIDTPRPIVQPTSVIPIPVVGQDISPVATPFESPIATPSSERDAVVQQATLDLQQRLGLLADRITVVRADRTELNIPDINCTPQAASSTVQPAQVLGWEIVLSASGTNFRYHIQSGQVTLCVQP